MKSQEDKKGNNIKDENSESKPDISKTKDSKELSLELFIENPNLIIQII